MTVLVLVFYCVYLMALTWCRWWHRCRFVAVLCPVPPFAAMATASLLDSWGKTFVFCFLVSVVESAVSEHLPELDHQGFFIWLLGLVIRPHLPYLKMAGEVVKAGHVLRARDVCNKAVKAWWESFEGLYDYRDVWWMFSNAVRELTSLCTLVRNSPTVVP